MIGQGAGDPWNQPVQTPPISSGPVYGGGDNGFIGCKAFVIVNKVWEADPLEAVLSARTAAAGAAYVPRPDSVQFVKAQSTRGLRGFVTAGDFRTEIWCIEELLPDGADKSSSLEKSKVLAPLLAAPFVRLVIGTGTAASTPELPQWGPTQNGCVVIGRGAFVHDGNPTGDPNKHWNPPHRDTVLESALDASAFAQLVPDESFHAAVTPRMMRALVEPADNVAPLVDPAYIALSDVNVNDPKIYGVADKATYDAFKALNRPEPVGALDTTLGVVRSCAPDGLPFMFVAGIVNRAYRFGEDVVPRPYAQNFVGAHNAGVAIAFMLPAIAAHKWPQ